MDRSSRRQEERLVSDHRCTEINKAGVRCLSTASPGDTRCPIHAVGDLSEQRPFLAPPARGDDDESG
jgi:hypothetical protein